MESIVTGVKMKVGVRPGSGSDYPLPPGGNQNREKTGRRKTGWKPACFENVQIKKRRVISKRVVGPNCGQSQKGGECKNRFFGLKVNNLRQRKRKW